MQLPQHLSDGRLTERQIMDYGYYKIARIHTQHFYVPGFLNNAIRYLWKNDRVRLEIVDDTDYDGQRCRLLFSGARAFATLMYNYGAFPLHRLDISYRPGQMTLFDIDSDYEIQRTPEIILWSNYRR